MKLIKKSLLALPLLAAAGSAMADAAGAATAIADVGGDVSTIGWAVIGVLVVAAGFKYLRRAL